MQSKRDEERKRNKSVTPFIKARNDREENREWEREGKGSGKSEDDQLPARPVRVSDLISEGKKKKKREGVAGRQNQGSMCDVMFAKDHQWGPSR